VSDHLPAEVSPTHPSGVSPLVTVVVPARNEEQTIEACLSSVLDQEEQRLQVIVVDGASTDRTAAIVETIAASDPRIESIRFGAASIPGSLNAALRSAAGRWLVRVDAHSTVPPDYVSKAVGLLETGRWGGVGGRKDAVADTTVGRAIAAALGSRFGVGNSIYHHGTRQQEVDHLPFGAYATESLRRLGGWDERLRANEDFELDRRMRTTVGPLLFDPELRIAWRCRETIGDLFRQYIRYGRGKADVAILHPASLRPRHLAPPILVLTLAGAVAAAPVWPTVVIAVVGAYAVGLAVAAAVEGRDLRGVAMKAWLPVAFAAMHVGWGIGFLTGLAAAALGRGPSGRGGAPVPIEGPASPSHGNEEKDRTKHAHGTDTTTRRIA
jgi:cellulose synthase/poly-beta-1,6-N-acetylglucosamine synthase-like glycosyltransferase